MKKILVVTNHSYMLWQFRKELLQEMQKYGEVIISMPFVGHEDDFRDLGFKCIDTKVDRRGINPKKDIKLFEFYKTLIKKETPDVVVTYSIKPNIYAGYACRKLGFSYCVNVQGLGTAFQHEPIASIVTFMYRIALKKAKTVFFENDANAMEFLNRKIVQENQETVLNGAGVNLEVYKQQPYPNDKSGLNFLFLGRIMKEKGVDEFFESAERLKNEYGEKVKFDFVGFFEDEYKEKVEDLVSRKIISFHGFQSDPKPFYANAHCVVLPSYHEGMSNVLLEASAIGRALITTNIHGCLEAVIDGKTGYLAEPKNADDLYAKMKKFIELPYEEKIKMGKASHDHIAEVFDKKKVVEKTIEKIMG